MTLADHVRTYVAFKRATGLAFQEQERLLGSFARHAAARGDCFVRVETVLEWASQSASPHQRQQRLHRVCGLAAYLHAEDERHELPHRDALGRATYHRPPPRLLSGTEIRQLMDAALELPPAGSITPVTFHSMLGLIAATGLRCDSPSDRLFVLASGRPVSPDYLTHTFVRLARQVGLRAGPGQPGPRLHDLRHGFAMRALESAVRGDRSAISRHMLALSTYLGHANATDTYWYLEATPVLLNQVSAATERLHAGRGGDE